MTWAAAAAVCMLPKAGSVGATVASRGPVLRCGRIKETSGPACHDSFVCRVDGVAAWLQPFQSQDDVIAVHLCMPRAYACRS